MTEKPVTSREGRPASYSRDLLVWAVDIVEAKGLAVTAPSVKQTLVGDLNLPSGLNVQSLDKELGRYLAERQESHERRTITALPDNVRTAVREQACAVEHGLLVVLGRVQAGLRTEAAREVEAERRERRQLAARCDDLTAAAVRDAETMMSLHADIAALRAERDALSDRLQESENERRLAESRHVAQADIVAIVHLLMAEAADSRAASGIRAGTSI